MRLGGDMMNADQISDKNRGKNPTDAVGPQHTSDPIAQNPKDIDNPEEAIKTVEVSRSNGVPILATNATRLPDRSWGLNQQMQPALSATDLLASILRFKWTILIVFVLVSVPAIVFIWTQIVPQYRARAELRIRPSIPRLVFRTEDSGPVPFYNSFVNTQVSIMRSPAVLQRVLDQPNVQRIQWYINYQKSFIQRLRGNIQPPLERLRDTLSVRPRPGTEIIDVDFIDPRAKDAKIIVDTVLNQYIQYIGEISDKDEEKLYRQLVEKYESLEKEILGRERTIAGLTKSLKTHNPQSLVSIKRIRIDDTKARLSALQQNITLLESAIDDSNDPVFIFADTQVKQPKYYVDPDWRELELNVKNLRHQIATSGLTSKHPNMIQMQKNLEFAEEMLRLQEARLDEQWDNRLEDSPEAPITITQWRNQSINVLGATVLTTNTGNPHLKQDFVPVTPLDNQPMNELEVFIANTNRDAPDLEQGLVSAEQQLAQAKRQEQFLNDELNKQQVEFDKLFDTAQSLTEENNALNRKRTLFDAVRQRLEQKNIERNVQDVIAKVEVLTKAFAPSQPHSDRRIVFTAMALFVGLGVGGGVGFLRATRSQVIYSPKDMPYPMQVPFLGYMPIIPTQRSQRNSKSLCSGQQSQPHVVESIRHLRTALLSRLSGQGNTVVLITSAVAGTGKSHFTMMLGESLAQAGKKVLIIDADIHKMGLTQRFNLSGKPGFIETLRCKSVDKRRIFPTEIFGLSIMPAGKRRDNYAGFEEAANGAFKTCIDKMRKQFNVILLDGSPILPVADAAILSNQVDGVIMVERELVSQRTSQIDAFDRLVSSGGHLLGTVFVGSGECKKYGYGYYGYK
ncbi:polysaccharide biosynthesis tyrosine autokinase [Planctomycetota bacterium]